MYRNKVCIKVSSLILVMVFFCLFTCDYSHYNSSINDNSSAKNSSVSYEFGKLGLTNLDILNSSIFRITSNCPTISSASRRFSKYLKLRINTTYLFCNNSYFIHNSRINKNNLARSLTITDCNIKINIDWINLKDGKKKISLL